MANKKVSPVAGFIIIGVIVVVAIGMLFGGKSKAEKKTDNETAITACHRAVTGRLGDVTWTTDHVTGDTSEGMYVLGAADDASGRTAYRCSVTWDGNTATATILGLGDNALNVDGS